VARLIRDGASLRAIAAELNARGMLTGAPANARAAWRSALKPWRKSMRCNARYSTRQLAVLAIGTSLLSGCATIASDGARALGACSPVLEYSRKSKARAAKDLALRPEGSAVVEMLSDYAVMRAQATVFGSP
jgi:hypothetical protein